jgi:hypothetical protein
MKGQADSASASAVQFMFTNTRSPEGGPQLAALGWLA